MADDEKVVSSGLKGGMDGDDFRVARGRRLARVRRLSEFRNLCSVNHEIHNWWQASFLREPMRGFASGEH